MAMPLIKQILNRIVGIENSINELENIDLDFNNKITELMKYKEFNNPTILADKTKIISITPLVGSNYSGFGNSFYYKIGTKVHVHLGLKDLTSNASNKVFIMPKGYRPNATASILGYSYGTTSLIGGTVYDTGSIEIHPQNAPYATFDFEYDAFN